MHEAALLCKDAQSALFVGRGMGAAILRGCAQAQGGQLPARRGLRRRRDEARPHCPDRPGLPCHRCGHQECHLRQDRVEPYGGKARGAKVIVVATEGDEEIQQIADCIIRVPAVRDVFSPITARAFLCSCSHARSPSCAAATSTSPVTWRKALLSSSWFRRSSD